MTITARERTRVRERIQYLKLEEMRRFCQANGLPIYIHVERPDGSVRRTGDRERKDRLLQRILDFALHQKRPGPTIYSKDVVSDQPLPERLTDTVRLRYGQYDKKNRNLIKKMQQLTNGAFRNGMIARLVLRDAWLSGTAPSLGVFAAQWLLATAAHTTPRPEGAYLVDLSKGKVDAAWKDVRQRMAEQALATLDQLVS